MKTLITALLILTSQLAIAADKIAITGEQANQIASLSFFAKGASGTSTFSAGLVKVICSRSLPSLVSQTPATTSDYTCVLEQPAP